MKYMGHKGKMLASIAEAISPFLNQANSISDPFCGSGAVSWYLCRNFRKQIISGDLQKYAAIRAASVVERTSIIEIEKHLVKWFYRADQFISDFLSFFPAGKEALNPTITAPLTASSVQRCRTFCSCIVPSIVKDHEKKMCILCAYGGYYFSPMQALVLDSLRQTLPKNKEIRTIFLSALIDAASRCCASPGHTAQPFQPTTSAIKFLAEAWERDVWKYVRDSAVQISKMASLKKGKVFVGDYSKCLSLLHEGDIVFADPPYSDVQYSRFYHVLETLAQGKCCEVSGVGRYPEQRFRPVSNFSKRSTSHDAAKELIKNCSNSGLTLILTFPVDQASNGLSTNDFLEIGGLYYPKIRSHTINSSFSTLGGNGQNREGRKRCLESIICLSY